MAKSRDEIFAQVQSTLVDALGVDEEEVSEGATLTEDLGAESIDFLDIVFRLDNAFGIKIPRVGLFPDELVHDLHNVDDGRSPGAGLRYMIGDKHPSGFSDFEKNPNIENVPSLFTVKTMVNYVEQKLAQQPA